MGVPVFGTVAKKIFGTRNERMVKRYLRIVRPGLRSGRGDPRAERCRSCGPRPTSSASGSRPASSAVDLIPEVFAVAREAMDRNVGIRNIFDPQFAFDPAVLDDEARGLYEQVKAKLATMEPAPPEGELLGSSGPVPAWQLVDIPTALYEAVRKAFPQSKPPFRARPFDVQIIGGDRALRGPDRGDEDRRGQDDRRPAVVLPLGARRPAGARRHGQRLPRAARPRLDLPLLPGAGPDGRRDPSPRTCSRRRRSPGVRVRRGVRHDQRVRLRLPARQHEAERRTIRCRSTATSRSWTRSTRSSSTRPARR